MDSVLLDTNVFSYVFNRHSLADVYKPHLEGKLKVVSFVTVGELYSGARKAGWGLKRVTELEAALRSVVVIPFDIGVCRAYGELGALKFAHGGARTLPANDRWIAACAIRHGVPLVSHNRKDFEGVPGLMLVSEALPI